MTKHYYEIAEHVFPKYGAWLKDDESPLGVGVRVGYVQASMRPHRKQKQRDAGYFEKRWSASSSEHRIETTADTRDGAVDHFVKPTKAKCLLV